MAKPLSPTVRVRIPRATDPTLSATKGEDGNATGSHYGNNIPNGVWEIAWKNLRWIYELCSHAKLAWFRYQRTSLYFQFYHVLNSFTLVWFYHLSPSSGLGCLKETRRLLLSWSWARFRVLRSGFFDSPTDVTQISRALSHAESSKPENSDWQLLCRLHICWQ